MMDITNKRAMVDQASQVSSNTTNAIFSAKKSKRDAGASLFQNSAQMAGSSASDFGQAANKAFDSQNAEIQILENINRTNSVSG